MFKYTLTGIYLSIIVINLPTLVIRVAFLSSANIADDGHFGSMLPERKK